MVDIEFVYDEGGVTTPAGFRASGVHAGFRKDPKRLDAALVVSDGPDTVSCGMFTRNVFCAAPVQLDRELLVDHEPRAVLLNSGNANAATGEPGLAIARKSAQAACRALGLPDGEVLVASTGVIGVELPWVPFETGIPALVESLSPDGGHDAACAIMTTDTHPKEHALRFTHDGHEYAVGGMVKGSGMIQPDMATMLAVITTDMPVAPETMRSILRTAVDVSFNKVTVDSDTSTNDSVFFFSSGVGAPVADAEAASVVLGEAVRIVCEDLARQIAADGEGATKLVTVYVRDAASEADADKAARTIANSPLVKTAIAGASINMPWTSTSWACPSCVPACPVVSTRMRRCGASRPTRSSSRSRLARMAMPQRACGPATSRTSTFTSTPITGASRTRRRENHAISQEARRSRRRQH